MHPFPPDFLWGSATSAHQVEGGNVNNDWWAWEQVPGHIKDGTTSARACEHFSRYAADFDLLASLGQNAHRLSLEWSRIEPRPGAFDAGAIAHYRRVLETLRARGLEPVVTLHHFTNPLWLARRGGWANPEVVERFTRFARRMAEAYGDLVRWWVTINEPNVYAFQGFLGVVWPPGRVDLIGGFRAMRHMVLAHARAYHAIHRAAPGARVGLAHHVRLFHPARPDSTLDRFAARARGYLFSRLVPLTLADGVMRAPLGRGDRVMGVAGTQDFVGLNYYTRERTAFDATSLEFFGREVRPPAQRNMLGWEIYPEGLVAAIRFASRFGPVLITENGVADRDDELRASFLLAHLRSVGQALAEGLPVLGYLHWSALDNFEWAEGLAPRFGLIHVDFTTQERRVKPSGELYARICRDGGLPLQRSRR